MSWHQAKGILCCVGGIGALPAYGLGIEFGYHDTEIVARGNAGVASADSASAVYYNPAMLGTGGGSEAILTGYALDYHVRHDGAGGHDKLEGGPAVAASAFTMIQTGEKSALGFGIYAPFGQKNEWNDDSPLRALATKTELLYLAGTMAYGLEVAPGLRVGASLSAVRSRVDLNRGILIEGDKYTFDADGQGWGAGGGFSWEPAEGHRIAGNVRWWSPLEYEGETTTRLLVPLGLIPAGTYVEDAELEVDFPVEWTLGYAWTPDKNWLFEVNLIYTEWSSFERFNLKSENSGTTVEPLDWEDSFKIAAGFRRSFDNGWWLSGGYWFAEKTTPDETFNPRLPDLALHVVSLGTGYQFGAWTCEFMYHLGYGNSREIRGSAAALNGTNADGQMTYIAHGISAGVRYAW